MELKKKIKELHKKLNSKNVFTLPIGGLYRYRKRGEVIPGGDLTPERFEKLIHYFKGFSFCGQISDPIFNPHLAELLKMCKDNHKSISVHTAASHRKKEWWNEVFDANTNARWMFGIDGLPEESHKYRINQDGEKLFKWEGLYKAWSSEDPKTYLMTNEEKIDSRTTEQMIEDALVNVPEVKEDDVSKVIGEMNEV